MGVFRLFFTKYFITCISLLKFNNQSQKKLYKFNFVSVKSKKNSS
jgi:hypothetical protein